MKYLLLLFIIGFTSASVSITEYAYRGTIQSGFPELGDQWAATGIRLALRMEQTDGDFSKATFQIQDVKVGNYNGPIDCNGRGEIPIEYKPMIAYIKELEKPFTVFYDRNNPVKMTVPADETMAITNMKKAITDNLHILPVCEEGNKPIPKDKHSYSTYEDTIHGTCETTTTFERFSSQRLPSEVQKYASLVPRLSTEGGLIMRRTINFDNCTDLVMFKKTGLNVKKLDGDFFRRSSDGTYFLAGSPEKGDLGLFRCNVEDDYLLSPYAINTQSMITVANSSMELMLLKSGASPQIHITEPMKNIYTYKFSFDSPYKMSQHEINNKEWVIYNNQSYEAPLSMITAMTGKNLTEYNIKHFMDQAYNNVEEAAEILSAPPKTDIPVMDPFDSETGKTIPLLYQCSQIVSELTKQHMDTIYKRLSQSKSDRMIQLQKDLFVDAVAASGTVQAYEWMFEKIMQGQISKAREASIYMFLPNNIRSSGVIEPLFRRMDGMRNDDPALPLLFINVATLARRTCFDRMLRNNSIPAPILGRDSCRFAKDNLLSFYYQRLQKTDNPSLQAILMQSFGNLGDERVFQYLKPYVDGSKKEITDRVRTIAIYNMARKQMPPHRKHQVLDILLGIIEDKSPEVSSRVRQAAFMTATSWVPNPSFWIRMAKSTWHNRHDLDLLFLVSSTIRNMRNVHSEQGVFANAAYRTMRRVPSMDGRSVNSISQWHERSKMMTTTLNLARLSNVDPIESYIGLNQDYNGLFLSFFEIALSSDQARNEQKYAGNPRFNGQRLKLKEAIDAYLKKMLGEHGHFYMSFFTNLDAILPYDLKNTNSVVDFIWEKIWNFISNAGNSPFVKYIQPVDNNGYMPTRLGYPITYKTAMPLIFYKNTTGVSHGADPTDKQCDVVTDIKMAFRFMGRSDIYNLPEEKRIVVGVDNEKVLNLPFKVRVATTNSDKATTVNLVFEPHYNKPFSMAHAHQMPYTSIKSLLPVQDVTNIKDYKAWKIIYKDPNHAPIFNYGRSQLCEATGIYYKTNWNGDVDHPLKWSMLYKYYKHPGMIPASLMMAPEMGVWRTSLQIDPSKSETKSVNIELQYDIQFPSTSAKDPKALPIVNGIVKDPITSKQNPHFLKTLEEKISSGKYRFSLKASADLYKQDYVTYDNYEANVVYCDGELQKASREQSLFVVAERSHNKKHPFVKENIEQINLDVVHKYPNFESWQQLTQTSKEQLKSDVKASFSVNTADKTNHICLDGHAWISDERYNLVKTQLEHMGCADTFKGRVPVLTTPAVYDHTKVTMQWSKNLPGELRNLTTKADILMNGVYFPQVSLRKDPHPDFMRRMTAHGDRKVGHEKWRIMLENENCTSLLDDIQLPFYMDQITPVGMYYEPEH